MILCCGEALIDMVPASSVDSNQAFAPLSGGAIFNTSIALGRLEVPVQFLSGVSTDLFGKQLVRDLRSSNVEIDYLVRSNRPTTLAFVKLTNGQAEYTFYDENSAGRMIETESLPQLDAEISTLYFGGISLCAEPAASTYEHLALREASNKVVMLDPNIRPSFIQDEVTYRNRLHNLIKVSDIVKVSDEDLDWIIPNAGSIETKVTELQNMGARLVVLTKGSKGATAYKNGKQVANVSASKVTVVDTVGAGDTFNAGFLAHLQKSKLLDKDTLPKLASEDIEAALAYAADVAAVTVSRKGANAPWLADL